MNTAFAFLLILGSTLAARMPFAFYDRNVAVGQCGEICDPASGPYVCADDCPCSFVGEGLLMRCIPAQEDPATGEGPAQEGPAQEDPATGEGPAQEGPAQEDPATGEGPAQEGPAQEEPAAPAEPATPAEPAAPAEP